MRFWLAMYLFFSTLPGFWQPPPAPAQVIFSDLSVTFRFGEQAAFQAKISPVGAAQEVFLFLQPEGEPTRSEKVTLAENGDLLFNYNLLQKPVRPFAPVEYWFRATIPGQDSVQSVHQFFNYEDNRFTWQSLTDGNYQVRWIQGDLPFGQAVLDASKAGLRSAASYLNYQLVKPLRIYVYPRDSDLQSAMQLGQKPWVAGHASPDLGVILVSIPAGPEQQLELERQIPHEIMHVLTYQSIGASYDRLPAWFLEGLASLAELNPNPDYQIALDRARETRTLAPFSSMCEYFPREASGAFLAYAESASFVRFLKQKFGSSGIQGLVTQYKNGLGCEEGVSANFGASLEQLEVRWQREVLGIDTAALIFSNLAPYLAAGLVLVVAPLGFALAFYIQKKPRSTEKPA
jgi:hypothetical protein